MRGERTHPVSLKVKSNLQIVPVCERVGGCWDILWKRRKKKIYEIPSSKNCTHHLAPSTTLRRKKYCLINVPKELWSYQQIQYPPTPPLLPWHFLGNCFSHYFISDISSSHVRLAPRQRPQRSQSHLCCDAAPSKLGLLCACVWGGRLTGEGEKESGHKVW